MHPTMRSLPHCRASSLKPASAFRSSFISAILFSSLLSQAYATTELSFFQHSTCNAGTAFDQTSDTEPLGSDIACHQTPNGTTALYVDAIDDKCTIRTYTSSTCDPSTPFGLLISAGTCFYIDETEPLGSWRADCLGTDYTYTNGDDPANSYSEDPGNPDVVEVLATATGAVTLLQSGKDMTLTVMPVAATVSPSAAPTSDVPAPQSPDTIETKTSTGPNTMTAPPSLNFGNSLSWPGPVSIGLGLAVFFGLRTIA